MSERLADAGVAPGRASAPAARTSGRWPPGSPPAHSPGQLDRLRSWLAGGLLPDGLALAVALRGRILFTLSARGLASDAGLATLAGANPRQAEQNRATCHVMRPNPAARQAAWRLALAGDQDWGAAGAYAPRAGGCRARRISWLATAAGTLPRCRRRAPPSLP